MVIGSSAHPSLAAAHPLACSPPLPLPLLLPADIVLLVFVASQFHIFADLQTVIINQSRGAQQSQSQSSSSSMHEGRNRGG